MLVLRIIKSIFLTVSMFCADLRRRQGARAAAGPIAPCVGRAARGGDRARLGQIRDVFAVRVAAAVLIALLGSDAAARAGDANEPDQYAVAAAADHA